LSVDDPGFDRLFLQFPGDADPLPAEVQAVPTVSMLRFVLYDEEPTPPSAGDEQPVLNAYQGLSPAAVAAVKAELNVPRMAGFARVARTLIADSSSDSERREWLAILDERGFGQAAKELGQGEIYGRTDSSSEP
jgi:hypothetical protein